MIGFPDDAAHVILFCGDIALVPALTDDGFYGLFQIEAFRAGEGNVVLRVKVVFSGNLARDATYIGICLNTSGVDAEGDFALLEGGGIVICFFRLLRGR